MTLRVGDTGGAVGKLHQALLEAGHAVEAVELGDATRPPIYGPSTEAAVRDFQTHHVDAAGHPLAVDGLVGPATLAALGRGAPASPTARGWRADSNPPAAVAAVIAAAVGDLGLHEDPDGSNDGPGLRKFKTYGQPWCALAVSTWWLAAPAGSPFGRIAAVWGLYRWARGRGALLEAGEAAQPGDLACFLRAGGHGHVGLVVGVEGGRLFTVEGNCANAVRGCIRERGALQAVIRPLKG